MIMLPKTLYDAALFAANIILILLQLGSATMADAVINDDGGGYVSIYEMRYANYKRNGTRVVLAGKCASACTRYMTLPNFCALPGSTFWFHAITVDGKVQPTASILDSRNTETPEAFRLQDKYDVWNFGYVKKRPRGPKIVELEPGVQRVYTDAATAKEARWQVWLKVEATKLVPTCGVRRRSPA